MIRFFKQVFLLFCYLVSFISLTTCSNERSIVDSSFKSEIEWQKTFGGSNDDSASGVIETNDGGYAIIGYTNSIDGDITDKQVEENDFWVLKLDVDGSVEWQKTYGGSGDDKGQDIIQTNDGGYAITGPSKSADGDASSNQGQHDHWILKLDAQGNIQWEKAFGFAGHDHSLSLIQTTDDGYLIGGYLDVSASGGLGNESFLGKENDSYHGVGEYWVQKLDASGNLEWRNYYGGSNNDRIYDILQTPNNNYLLVGSSESDDFDITQSKGSYDFWVVKINNTGTLIWEKSYGGSGNDNAYAATKTIDGNYLIAGTTNSTDGDISQNKGNADLWVVKIANNDGHIIWKKLYGGSGFDSAQAIFSNNFDEYTITGNTKSSDGDATFNNGENDFWVIKIDGTGNLLFEKSLGGSGLDFAYGVVETSDQKIVIVGETDSSNNDVTFNNGSKDIWIVKLK